MLKSTIPIGAEEKFDKYLRKGVQEQGKPCCQYSLICVPEFLAEGSAIENLLKPDRVIIGGAFDCSKEDLKLVRDLYNWIEDKRIIYTNSHTAELGKLASNAMLAQRVSSINSFSAICEKTEANIMDIKAILGSDSRIGPYFLNPSPGFGGSCFKKDVLSLVYICEKLGLHEVALYWNSVIELNEYQKRRLAQKIIDTLPSKTISIFGASFKQGTSDIRDSASLYFSIFVGKKRTICAYLLQNGLKLNIYDPKADRERVFYA